jgi:hypothetical protein
MTSPRIRGVVRATVVPNLTEATVEHWLLGANITLAKPINAQAGDRLLLLIQGNGFSITYDPAFATTSQPAGTSTTAMEYYFDGSKWWLLYHS